MFFLLAEGLGRRKEHVAVCYLQRGRVESVYLFLSSVCSPSKWWLEQYVLQMFCSFLLGGGLGCRKGYVVSFVLAGSLHEELFVPVLQHGLWWLRQCVPQVFFLLGGGLGCRKGYVVLRHFLLC